MIDKVFRANLNRRDRVACWDCKYASPVPEGYQGAGRFDMVLCVGRRKEDGIDFDITWTGYEICMMAVPKEEE